MRCIDLTLLFFLFLKAAFVEISPEKTWIMVATNKMRSKSTEGPVERRYEQVCMEKGECFCCFQLFVCVVQGCSTERGGKGCPHRVTSPCCCRYSCFLQMWWKCFSNIHPNMFTAGWPEFCVKVLSSSDFWCCFVGFLTDSARFYLFFLSNPDDFWVLWLD